MRCGLSSLRAAFFGSGYNLSCCGCGRRCGDNILLFFIRRGDHFLFSQFSCVVVFATYSYSSGAGIYAFSLFRNSNDFNRLFLWTGGVTRRVEDPGFGLRGVTW